MILVTEREKGKVMADASPKKEPDADIERLRAEIDKLRADISSLGESIGDIASNRVKGSYEAIRRTSQALKDEARGEADALAREIEQKPLTFLAGAFGVGLLLGILTRGQR